MKILGQYLNELTTILHYRPALDLHEVLYENDTELKLYVKVVLLFRVHLSIVQVESAEM